VLLGAGSVVGAAVALSHVLVEETVERLLGERMDMAQTTGVVLEQWLRSDVERLAGLVRPALQLPPSERPERLKGILSGEFRSALLQHGALVMRPDGAALAASSEQLIDDWVTPRVRDLVVDAVQDGGIVASPLIRAKSNGEGFLVLALSLSGRVGDGTVGALVVPFRPATTVFSSALLRARRGQRTQLELVDSQGLVVATTEEANLGRQADHESLLTKALHDRAPVKGRCHSCHEQTPRATEILAFAPLPTLDLGVAVHQPESEALAPAFALRGRLVLVGGVFGTLFLILAGWAVRSVVLPVTRLTGAVRGLERGGERKSLPAFGQDEVGELARALDRWRGRVDKSLAEVERHRAALGREVEATRQHLGVLDDLTLHGTQGAETTSILEHGIGKILELIDAPYGAIQLSFSGNVFVGRRGLSEEDSARLLSAVEEKLAEVRFDRDAPTEAQPFRTAFVPFDRQEVALPAHATQVGAALSTLLQLRIVCVVCSETERRVEERWLLSLLHHVAVSAANRLLRERDLVRTQQQEQYLHRALTAQEDERRRVARELHDTLAQDLAAIRFDIERISNRPSSMELRTQLADLESRTHGMLVMLRQILSDLRLSILEPGELLPLLQSHLERLGAQHGTLGVLNVVGNEVQLPYAVALTLFRIFQESLQNVTQHAKAEHVFVTVDFRADQVVLTVEDDGCGFDMSEMRARKPQPDGRGLGLLGIEERARLLGGHAEITSRPAEGTTVEVVLPLSGVAA